MYDMNAFDEKRIEYNKKIVSLLKSLNLGYIPELRKMLEETNGLMNKYPYMRFGQVVCNFICPNYMDKSIKQTEHEKMFMKYVFRDCKIDPFYEEPWDTLKRIQENP